MTWNLDTFANAMVLECGDKEQSDGKNEDEMETGSMQGFAGRSANTMVLHSLYCYSISYLEWT